MNEVILYLLPCAVESDLILEGKLQIQPKKKNTLVIAFIRTSVVVLSAVLITGGVLVIWTVENCTVEKYDGWESGH